MNNEDPIYAQITDFFKTQETEKIGPNGYCANCSAPNYSDSPFCNDSCAKDHEEKIRSLLSR